MAMKTADIRQVAELAGVSVGTVSNVLNRPDSVAELTRNSVLAAIEELGYVRNGSASRLRSARSQIVGLVVLDTGNPFFAEVARGAEEALERRGYSVVLCNSDGSAKRQQRHLQFLDEQRVAGILITPVDPKRDRHTFERMRARGMSIVLVDEAADSGTACSVAVDDLRGGELAGNHLIDIGRRRIVFIGATSVRQSEDRCSGLRRAVEHHNRGAEVSVDVVRVPALNGRSGHAAIGEVLGYKPDAIFCANDTVALGVLLGLFENGRSVPDEIALVGFDDIEFARLAAVPLTSVRQPAAQIGDAAASLLISESAQDRDHRHQKITFSPELIVRRSTTGA